MKAQAKYTIIVHPDPSGGFWTDVPALPGCGSQGETVEAAVEMTKDAIAGYIASLRAHGDPVPKDATIVVKVTVAA